MKTFFESGIMKEVPILLTVVARFISKNLKTLILTSMYILEIQ